MKKGVKRTAALLLAALLLAGLCGCAKQEEEPLPEGFDEEVLKQTTITAVERVTAGDFQGVWDMFNADLQALLPPEQLRETLTPALEKLGAFEQFGSYKLVVSHDDTLGDYVTVLVAVKFADGHTTFRVSVDGDGLLCGLYM